MSKPSAFRRASKLSPLGHRILRAQADLAETVEDVGYLALARQLMIERGTALRILTEDNPVQFLGKGPWSHLVDRICEVLRVRREWLFDVVVRAETPETRWYMQKRLRELV